MLENWHQMDGDWLETINIYIYNAHMKLLPFLWFSMKLNHNSFLIVCFTMVQQIFRSEKFYKISYKNIM